MTTRTSHSLPARNMAACPAELPPPSTTTGFPAQTFASVSVAAYAMPAPSSSLQRSTGGRRYSAPVATTTDRAGTSLPSSSRTTCQPAWGTNPATRQG